MKLRETLEEEISNMLIYLLLKLTHSNTVFEGDKHKGRFREQRSQYTCNGSEKFDNEVEV